MLLPVAVGVPERPENSAALTQLPHIAALRCALCDLAPCKAGCHRYAQLLFQFVPPLGPSFTIVCGWLSEERTNPMFASLLVLLLEVIR
jgi:membrane protein YqaA with SNARE-associated domain